MPLTIDNLLHDFIFNLSGVGFGLPAQQGVGIPPMYVFCIVTALSLHIMLLLVTFFPTEVIQYLV